MKHHEVCDDCGAFLQEYRRASQTFLRCPWVREEDWRLDTYRVVTAIFCNRPLGTKRIMGGIRVESVA